KPARIPLTILPCPGIRSVSFDCFAVTEFRGVAIPGGAEGALNLLALLLARALHRLQQWGEFPVNFVGRPRAQGASQDHAEYHGRESLTLGEDGLERFR